MKYYSHKYCEAILKRIFLPNSKKMVNISRETGIPLQTLSTWKSQAAKTILATLKIYILCF